MNNRLLEKLNSEEAVESRNRSIIARNKSYREQQERTTPTYKDELKKFTI